MASDRAGRSQAAALGVAGGRRRLSRLLSAAAHGTQELPAFRAAYEAVVAVETAAARWGRTPRRVSPVAPDSLTLVVKTFERPQVLRRMLASVRRVYSGPIVVADDSRVPYRSDDPLVTVLALPFDAGVGAGRNALLDAVATQYVWMADDDMVVLPDLDIARVLGYLERNPGVDLVGGRVVNLPLWRTADYSAAALFAYEGAPRLVEGTIVDGLPVYYKVPNFYVARTDAVRAVRYDDRLRRVDHNDFFTSAYGRLACVHDRALVCLHAHSHFDPHYQAFRMDTAADLAYLGEKWRGRGVSRLATGESGGVGETTLRALHHAALQVVAGDLGVRVVHGGPGGAPRVLVPARDAARYVGALTQLGWRSEGRRLVHPLWGGVVVEPGVEGGVPAAFAGVAGLAAGAGEWPEPTAAPGAAVGGRRVRWGERVGWVDEGERISAATLPLGPVVTLEPPADSLWEAVGPAGLTSDEVVAAVLAAYPDAPPEAADQLRGVLADLTARGLLFED